MFDLPTLPQDIGAPASDEDIAAGLGVAVSDIGVDGLRPARWSAGTPYSLVPLGDLAAIGRCTVNPVAWKKAFGFDAPRCGLSCSAAKPREPGHAFHARMFAPGAGITKIQRPARRPRHSRATSPVRRATATATIHWSIEQGYEMGRASLIELTLKIAGGKLTGASIGGSAVVVMEGAIEA